MFSISACSRNILSACFFKVLKDFSSPRVSFPSLYNSSTNPSGASGWGVKLLFDLIKDFDYKI